MTVIVFLGPSLHLDEARQILPEAIYLPPAGQADLVSAITTFGPSVVGLIDGLFDQSLSVWHKEVLYALQRGVRVYGAASMGALRAAELGQFGMVGLGEIYRRFAAGELEDDDEVAVLHASAEDDFRALSHPMINVRATFERAEYTGSIAPPLAELVTRIAKNLHFPERNLPNILWGAARAGATTEQVDQVRGCFETAYVDLKAADARLLLQTIADGPLISSCQPVETVARSRGLDLLLDHDRTVREGPLDVPLGAIAARAALREPDFDEFNSASLNRVAALQLAELLKVEPTEAEVEEEQQRFMTQRGLATEPELETWQRANDLSADDFQTLMRELATCRRLQRLLLASTNAGSRTRWLLDELRLRGRYSDIKRSTALQAHDQMTAAVRTARRVFSTTTRN
jgi:hypothetical protein